MRLSKTITSIIFILLFLFHIPIFANTPLYGRPDVQAFINMMAKKYGYNREILANMFGQVQIEYQAVQKVSKPFEAQPWYIYRDSLITPERIQKGVDYWQQHADTLALAEKQYGIPANIIVGIIGLETAYGEHKGKFPVFNTLTTLAFNNSRRSEFFKDELINFLLLTREHNFKPLEVTGSYAGAIGVPQFMPSSYRRYAVDFSGKGYSDLINNHEDAIASVANYLQKKGWETGKLITLPAKVNGEKYKTIERKNLKPELTVNELNHYGVDPQYQIDENQKALLLRLEEKNGEDYWLGLHNFYVISTYNPSELYVMAVYQLGQKILEQRHQQKQDQVQNTNVGINM